MRVFFPSSFLLSFFSSVLLFFYSSVLLFFCSSSSSSFSSSSSPPSSSSSSPSPHLTRAPLSFLSVQILFFLLRYNFATSDNDHGRFGEVAAAILSFASAPGGGTSPSASESSLSPPSSTTLDNSITCRNLFYRSIACFTRTRPLHNMLVNGGLIQMLKQFIDRMLFEDNIDYEVEGMNPVEASTIGVIILCTCTFTSSLSFLPNLCCSMLFFSLCVLT